MPAYLAHPTARHVATHLRKRGLSVTPRTPVKLDVYLEGELRRCERSTLVSGDKDLAIIRIPRIGVHSGSLLAMSQVWYGRARFRTHQVETVGIDRVSCERIHAPVVPPVIIHEVEERSPSIIRVKPVRASDISTGVGKALLRRVENDVGDEASTTSNLHVLPSVSLRGDGSRSKQRRARRHSEDGKHLREHFWSQRPSLSRHRGCRSF